MYLSGKTAIGVWLDEKGGPSGYKRGYTTVDFETEAQVQQRGATLRKAPEFGAELPAPEHINRKPPATKDLFDPKYSGLKKDTWQTNTMALYETGRIKVWKIL